MFQVRLPVSHPPRAQSLLAVALLVGVGGVGASCSGVPLGWESLPVLDRGVYVATIEPILVTRCANPSCHARPERPFSLYAPGMRRLDSARDFLPDEPLLAAEVEHNYQAASAFAGMAAGPEDTLLVRKPLGDLAGTYHGGGAVFDGTKDRAYRAVLDWVRQGWRP